MLVRRRALCLLPVVAACAAAAPSEELQTEQAALSTYTDNQAWSQQPPGYSPVDVPQFVAVTFDDNYDAGLGDPPGAMTWALNLFAPLKNPAGSGFAGTFDGADARTSFYNNSYAVGNPGVLQAWVKAREGGHELANHTKDHAATTMFSEEDWTAQIVPCTEVLTKAEGVAVPPDALRGFRSPYLFYSTALFPTLKKLGFWYDTSVQSCWGDGQDGKNCGWPHTLDQPSPDGTALMAKFAMPEVPVTTGLWEMSTTALFVPADDLAAQYGIEPGLRGRIAAIDPKPESPNFYEPSTGRLAPLDITLFKDFGLSGPEVLAILKHTLDLRLMGNRAPFIFIAHTHVYGSAWDTAPNAPKAPSFLDRQAVIEQFVQYALSKPVVRMRPVADIMDWMRAPKPLDNMVTMPVTTAGTGGGGAGSAGGGPGVGGAAGSGAGGTSAGAGSAAGSPSGGSGNGKRESSCDCRTAPGAGTAPSWLALAALAGMFGRRRPSRARS